MRYVKKYTGDKTYLFPNGAIATPEVIYATYPAAREFTFALVTDSSGETIYQFQSLSSLKAVYDIDEADEDTAISLIQEKMNEPAPAPVPTAEERIAAALEYQNMIM